MTKSPLILGSASPRRLDLLKQICIEPDLVLPADIDETPEPGEQPRAYAARMAAEKLAAVDKIRPKGQLAEASILTGDTVVAVGRRILPKAETQEQALACLKLMSGRRHQVFCALSYQGSDGSRSHRLGVTQVKVKRLDVRQIQAYLDTGEWRGKAGGYAIQGYFARFVPWLSGSYSGVVGLDLNLCANLLGS